ncbi:MAG: hypothetical protein ABI671_05465 [Burkholderiales bacterium]
MKYHEIDLPASRLRRTLLLGLPGGLALATPLGMLGCGGSDDTTGQAPAGDNSLHDSGRSFAGDTGFSEVTIGVEVPAGVKVPAGGLATHTLLGGFGVVSAGTATLRTAFAGPQLATLYTADRLPLLFGFVGEGLPALSARSTATALIAFAVGTEWFEGSTSRAWIAEVHASAAAAALADVIAAELVADVYAVADSNLAIDAALVDAVRALLPASATSGASSADRARPLGIGINPPNAASGVQPIIAETLNTIYVQNEKLRRAWYVVHREGHITADGTAVPDAGRTVVVSGDIPMLPAFDSASSIVGSVTTAVYGGDDTGLAFSKTAETTLALSPDGARSTVYSVTALMAGNSTIPYDQAALDKLTYEEKLKIDISLFSTENLGLQTLMIDLLMPMFMSWLGGKVSDLGGGAGPREWKEKVQVALMGQLLGVLSSTLPPIVAKLKDPKTYPDYGVAAALTEIARTHLVVFVDVPVPGRAKPVSLPALSKFSISMLILLLKFIAYEKLDVANGEALLKILEGDANDSGERKYSWDLGKGGDGKDQLVHFDKENLAYAGIGVAMKALGTVDTILGNVGKLRAVADIATSKLFETWEVKATKPKLRLNPDPFEVKTAGIVYPVKIEIVDNDSDIYGNEKGSFRFDWVCTGLYGDLFKRNGVDGAEQEKNKFSTSNTNATTDYLARTTVKDAGAETITVTAYFEPIGSGKPAELIGTVTTAVKFKKAFSLSLSPPGPTDVPTDSGMSLTAFLKETLPAGSTVDWEWTHAGAGSLAAAPTDANPADNSVSFKSTSAEGAASVTVRATVNVPAVGATPAHALVTDSVSATLNVKKGLKTITMEVSAGVFGCTACGVSEYTAYIVPRLAKATSYTAVLSGFAYPSCNRSVTWSTTKADGGGCNFPVTYHPNNSADATDQWAVWIGFGGEVASGNKCIVTVTLAP